MKRIVYYLNQFFGQIGGEEAADQTPLQIDKMIGPGIAFQQEMQDEGEIVGTIICGDNYFADHQSEAINEMIPMIEKLNPDLFVAGPGFNAGRYGMACGALCDAVKKELSIPVLTALYPENPGVDLYKKYIYIIKAPATAAGMKKVVPVMAKLAKKMLRDEEIGFPEEEGYIPQGYRVNVHTEKNGAERGVEMLMKKLRGEPFVTELPMPVFEKVPPAPAIPDLAHARIAMITSGGIVPQGNPDHIESANASRFGIYDITGMDNLTSATHMTVHGGYDPVYATDDPDRVLPLDAMRQIEKEGGIGELYNYYYATVGNTTAVANAKKYAEDIAEDMLKHNVQAAILTSN